MFVFFVLYILVWRATQRTFHPSTARRSFAIPFATCLLYAALDEFHQSLTPGRSATWRDVGYDALGSTIGALWWYRYL